MLENKQLVVVLRGGKVVTKPNVPDLNLWWQGAVAAGKGAVFRRPVVRIFGTATQVLVLQD